ncbi:MAG: hypothetical protein WBK55_08275 [Alphaproteobacteria bacterium]
MRKASVVGVNESPYDLSTQVQVHQGQRWSADIRLPTMRNNAAAAWEAFFGKLNGREGTFLLGDPYREIPQGTAASDAGTPKVDGAHAARVNQISVKEAPANAGGYLLKGDYFQLGAAATATLHQLLENADVDSDGTTNLLFWPRSREILADNAAITVLNPKGVFRLASNITEVARQPGRLSDLAFSAVEAF